MRIMTRLKKLFIKAPDKPSYVHHNRELEYRRAIKNLDIAFQRQAEETKILMKKLADVSNYIAAGGWWE